LAGWKPITHVICDLFRGEKVKVTTPTNAHTVNARYLPNWKAYEHHTCILSTSKTLLLAY